MGNSVFERLHMESGLGICVVQSRWLGLEQTNKQPETTSKGLNGSLNICGDEGLL